MQLQPDLAIYAHQQMLAMALAGFEASPFQLARELGPGNALQHIRASYIHIVDARSDVASR